MNIFSFIESVQNNGLDNELKDSFYSPILSEIQGQIHTKIVLPDYDVTRIASDIDYREENWKGKIYRKAVIFLLSNGCEWALKNGHGCVMCGHIAKQAYRQDKIKSREYIQQFDDALSKINSEDDYILCLFNNGSFLNENEIDIAAQQYMLKKINAEKKVKLLIIESRPEYITEKKILNLKKCIPDKDVEIAVGLEIRNDLYRTFCLNKGFSLDQFERAAAIIRKWFLLRVYVLLKPPFISEAEAIDSTIDTIQYAFAQGANTISLEGCTVQKNTLLEVLFKRSLYKPPWLWSIIEVVKSTAHLGRLIIGMFKFYPPSDYQPYNCHLCTPEVMKALAGYNRSYEVNDLFAIDCKCKSQWQAELLKKYEPFDHRFRHILSVIKKDVFP